jgi:hypothetical protein
MKLYIVKVNYNNNMEKYIVKSYNDKEAVYYILEKYYKYDNIVLTRCFKNGDTDIVDCNEVVIEKATTKK